MNGCISFNITPINTELENVANFNVLVLTIWVSYCLSNNNRLVPSPFRFETWPCPSLPSVATDYRKQFHNLVLPVPTERERERRENLGTKQCLKINLNNNTGLLFFGIQLMQNTFRFFKNKATK